ncbi:MAG: response regulator [Oligoflexus sp.]
MEHDIRLQQSIKHNAPMSHMEDLSTLIFTLDSELALRSSNPSAQKWLKRDAHETNHRDFAFVLGKENFSRLQGRMEEAMKGRQVAFQAGLSDKDGISYLFEIVLIPQFADNRFQGLTAVWVDISGNQSSAENLLAAPSTPYKNLIESIPKIFICLIDEHGRALYINSNWSHYTGLDLEQSLNTSWAESVHPEDLPSIMNIWQNAWTKLEPCDGKFRLRSRFGKYRWFEFYANPMPQISDEPIRWVSVTIDVDDTCQSQSMLDLAKKAAEEANKAKSNFIAHISHEIRTPLTSIIGYAEFLKTHPHDEDTRKNAIEAIYRNGKHLLSLIHDVLDFSKLESGQIEVERASFQLEEEIDTVITMFQTQLAKIGCVRLTSQFLNAFPATVISDPVLFRQILVNIVGNAVKFTEEGFIELKIKFQKDHLAPRQGQIIITVEDTGIGMSEKVQADLFRAFHQGSRKHRVSGTGLGLALSRQYARILDGDLSLLRSEEDKGSCFQLHLPVGLTNDLEFIDPFDHGVHASAPSLRMESLNLKNKRILIIEDSRDIQNLLSILFKSQGAEVISAFDGEEGLQLALAENYDLVLLDIQLPSRDGYEICQILRKQQRQMPLIAMTAHVTVEERNQCRALGFDDYLSKPIDFKRLYAILCCYLN